jgi:hypothetical protein
MAGMVAPKQSSYAAAAPPHSSRHHDTLPALQQLGYSLKPPWHLVCCLNLLKIV